MEPDLRHAAVGAPASVPRQRGPAVSAPTTTDRGQQPDDVVFEHLVSMSTPYGVYERAQGPRPCPGHGYRTDDMARVLVVAVRQPDPEPAVRALARTGVEFLEAAADPHGGFCNRRADRGQFSDLPSTDEHWARALWGLSQVVASTWCPAELRRRALHVAGPALWGRSPQRRPMAQAAVAAAELVRAGVQDAALGALLVDAGQVLAGPRALRGVPWPEAGLSHGNALLPEAHLAIGEALDQPDQIEVGLLMLGWLSEVQTRDGHLSPVPVDGWQPGQARPGFDQRPAEVAALAEAASRAHRLTAQREWADLVVLCAEWFLGRNDLGTPMYENDRGAGFDLLTPDGPSPDLGSESTAAALTTLQLARRIRRMGPSGTRTG